MNIYLVISLLLVLTASALPAQAQNVFEVNSTGDESDAIPGNGICRTASGSCTLRAAIEEADASQNIFAPDRIHFTNIPIMGGQAIINIVGDGLPLINDRVVIDGTTAAGEVVIDGTNSSNPGTVYTSTGLVLHNGSDGSKVRGLTIGNFHWYGIYLLSSGNTVVNNRIGVLADGSDFGNDLTGIWVSSDNNTLGKVDNGNVIGFNGRAGIHISNGQNNTIRGNYVGTDEAGLEMGNYWPTQFSSDIGSGIFIDGDNNIIGGSGEGMGNTIGFNYKSGIFLNGVNNIVRGNFIGVDGSGRNIGNFHRGIYVGIDGINNTIGGALDGMENTIGFNPYGFLIAGSDNKIQGNLIGTNANGDDIGNDEIGIALSHRDANENVIGYGKNATIPPQFQNLKGNTIAYNGIGVRVGIDVIPFNPAQNSIRGNIIFENDELGIDLGEDHVTPNDYDDADSGGNMYMNYPDITRAFFRAGSNAIIVEYSMSPDSAIVNYPINVDIYLADDETSGEGMTYLGTDLYTTPNLEVIFEIDANSVTWASTDYVVLTATDADGNTSEFSPPAGELGGPGYTASAFPSQPDGNRMRLSHSHNQDTGLAVDLSTYPNPFNPQTTVRLLLREASPIRISVHDILGRQVALVHDAELPSNVTHSFTFDGSELASGIYLLRVEGTTFAKTKRITLIK